MIRKILRSGDAKLRVVSRPVAGLDKKVAAIIQDLKDTLIIQKDPEGVGLAAPQIGKNLRIFVINHLGVQRVIINPKILKSTNAAVTKKAKKETIMEGCLSLPNYYGDLKRASLVKIKYLNEEGKEAIEVFDGLYAQIVLHEIDHLEGKLFIDRLLEQKQPLYKLNKGEWEEVEL